MNSYTFIDNIESTDRVLYTPSSFARKNLLHLQEIGKLRAAHPHEKTRENLSSYLFFMVESGSGSLTYHDNFYPLISGDCVFIDCKIPYTHSTSEQLWQLHWVHFYGPNMDAIYEKYKERGGTAVFHPTDYIRYELLLNQIKEISQSASHVRDMQIYEKLTALLTLLMEDSREKEPTGSLSSKRENLLHIKEFLDEHYRENISLDMLSETFYVNKFYLTRIFKEQYGTTIHNYILQLRITHAKQLLRFSDFSIDEIGEMCGLRDANYFSRMFKKVEGMSPGKFRKIW